MQLLNLDAAERCYKRALALGDRRERSPSFSPFTALLLIHRVFAPLQLSCCLLSGAVPGMARALRAALLWHTGAQ